MALNNTLERCESLTQALKMIFAKFGTEVLVGERTLYSMALDFLTGSSPDNKRSLNLIQNAMQQDILRRIYDAIGKDTHTQINTLAVCKKLLVDNCGTADTTAEEFVYAFGAALDWKLPAPAKKTAPSVPPSVTVSKPAAPPPTQKGQTAEEQYQLGEACNENKNYTEAIKWYLMAADRGHAMAQDSLGRYYRYGTGVTENDTEGAKWFRLAAEQGHAGAQYNLGACYYLGAGVPKSYSEAVKWWRLAAEQEHVYAQFRLASCYEIGQGIKKDIQEAKKWYKLAADNGDRNAASELERLNRKKWFF